MQYFNDIWHPIKDEWTMFGCNKHFNLNRTSNRVESLNHKLKLVIAKNSNLTKFFADLNVCIDSISSEKNLKAVKSTMRVKRQRILDPVETAYADYDQLCI